MISRTDWELMVVGAGPAGSMAATVAASKGLAVLLIDAKPRIGEQPHCGECVQAGLFDEFNLDKSCWIQPLERMSTYILDSPESTTNISKAAEIPMKGITIDRVRFDRDLARTAASAGATVISSARFVRRESGAWIVRFGERELPIRPRIVVAADGARSRVAAEMGIQRGEFGTGLQLEVPVPAPTKTVSIYLCRAFYGGYGWLIPKGTTCNVGIGVVARPSTNLPKLLGAFLESLSGWGMISSGKLAVYAGSVPFSGIQEPLVKENVIFCGDAGGFTDPLTGSGIAQAISSGNLAGEAAARAVETGTLLPLNNYGEMMTASYRQSQQPALAARKLMMSRWDEPDFEKTCKETWLSSLGLVNSAVTLSSYLRSGS